MTRPTAKQRWQSAHRATRILFARGVEWHECGVVVHTPRQVGTGHRAVVWRFGAARTINEGHWAETLDDERADKRRTVLGWLRHGLNRNSECFLSMTGLPAYWEGLVAGPMARLP